MELKKITITAMIALLVASAASLSSTNIHAKTINGLTYQQRLNAVKGQTPVGTESLVKQAKYGIPVTKQNATYQDIESTRAIVKSGQKSKPNRHLKAIFLRQLKKHYINGKDRSVLLTYFDCSTHHGEEKLLQNVKHQSVVQDYIYNLIRQFKERNYKNYK